jgi:hypothetical protein
MMTHVALVSALEQNTTLRIPRLGEQIFSVSEALWQGSLPNDERLAANQTASDQ